MLLKTSTDGKICNWNDYIDLCAKIKRNIKVNMKKGIYFPFILLLGYNISRPGTCHDIVRAPFSSESVCWCKGLLTVINK